MDKYEYRVKTEQMLEYTEKKQYKKAMEIADTIDWRRVKNASMLNSVSEIYELNGEFQKSRDILFVAYDRSPGSRKIVYRLGTLALKVNDTEEASDCYEEFIKIAPKDPNQFILKYKILKSRRMPLAKQIEALEEFKKAEYVEKWAYELAKLYHEAGMVAECLEECDDLILWFSEGKYVYQAMELKMKYKPLTPLQQEKYDNRFAEEAPIAKDTSPIAMESQEEQEEQAYQEEAEDYEESEEPVIEETTTEPDRKPDIHEITDNSEVKENEPVKPEPMETEQELQKTRRIGEDTPICKTVKGATLAEALANGVAVATGLDLEDKGSTKRTEDMRITGQMKIEEILQEWEEKQKANAEAIEFQKRRDEEKLMQKRKEAQRRREEEARRIEEQQRAAEEARRIAQLKAEEEARKLAEQKAEEARILAEQKAEEERRIAREKEAKEERMLEQLATGRILNIPEDLPPAETMQSEAVPVPVQEVLAADAVLKAEAAEVAAELTAEAPKKRGVRRTKKTAAPEEEKAAAPKPAEKRKAKGVSDTTAAIRAIAKAEQAAADSQRVRSGLTADLRQLMAELEEIEQSDDLYEESYDKSEQNETDYEEEMYSESNYDETEYEESYEDDDYEEYDNREEEYMEEQDNDFFDEDEEEVPDSTEAVKTPVNVEELVIEEPTEEEIQKRIQKGKAGVPFDTGFVVTGRYDLSATSEIGLKAGLTEEQKKLFSYFVPVRGMSEQIVEALDNDRREQRQGTSAVGNIIILGPKGNGKTVLAVNIVKAIQKQRNLKQGKVAIVTGESMNKKEISNIIQKLKGGAIIIEKAGKLNTRTVEELNHLMEGETGELLVVLEDERKPLERLFTANREFRKKFTSKLELPAFINDELVTFGQTYAKENGYKLDEMGILALYSRVDVMQREDHAVTVTEVKEIMDHAIEHSQKANVKHLARRVFGKGTDDSDRIILKEEDFRVS